MTSGDSAAPTSVDGEAAFSLDRWIARAYRRERPLDFRAETVEDWRAWRAQLREKILELSGLVPPPESCDLAPRVVDMVELRDHGVVREKVVYQSEPGVTVPAYLLRPMQQAEGRRPAVLALHGHGGAERGGKSAVAGAADDHPTVPGYIAQYNYDYGLQLARRGYVVLCPDARGFGERGTGWWMPPDADHAADPCDRAGNKAALLGFSLLGLTVWDDRRGLDYLQSRGDVDPERIGVAGLSLGGTRATFLAALDDRVTATVVSGYLNTFKSYALDRTCCGSQIVPGLLRWAELPDVTALVAPRPLLIEAGLRDEIFPIDGSREAYGTLERAFRLLDAEDRLWRDEFDGPHRWHGSVAAEFLDCYLQTSSS